MWPTTSKHSCFVNYIFTELPRHANESIIQKLVGWFDSVTWNLASHLLCKSIATYAGIPAQFATKPNPLFTQYIYFSLRCTGIWVWQICERASQLGRAIVHTLNAIATISLNQFCMSMRYAERISEMPIWCENCVQIIVENYYYVGSERRVPTLLRISIKWNLLTHIIIIGLARIYYFILWLRLLYRTMLAQIPFVGKYKYDTSKIDCNISSAINHLHFTRLTWTCRCSWKRFHAIR